MRKTILFLLVLVSIFSNAQVSMENVLIEMGTATWSNGCAGEATVLQQLKEQELDIVIINYHLNDPFANQYSNARASFYNIQSVPYPIVQGTHIVGGDIQNYVEAYNEAINLNSSFVITANGNFLGDTLFMELAVQKVSEYESDEIKLHIALIESNIAYEWLQQEEVDEVERSMSPDAGGTYLDFSSSDTETIFLEALLDENWNPSEMELVAFVQNDTSKQILQCHSVSFTHFSPLPVHAFFQAEDTSICRKDYVAFENFSTGDVETYEWYFEGGIPEYSSNEFPIVQYNEAGEFDVRLIVSNSISLDTTLKEDYIEVKELPDIGFAPLPVFCHDDPPYELIQGWPEEGNYFGLFVDTGYFHPESAGPGEYTVYFAYQNEETLCSDTLSQLALVDLCNAINETQDYNDISWHLIGNQLDLKLPENLSTTQTQVLIYNTFGQLLMNPKRVSGKEISLNIPPRLNQFLLVIKSEKETEVFKILR